VVREIINRTMTGDNLTFAREVLDALESRDTERLLELSDPEVEWRSFFPLSEKGVYKGEEGTRRFQSDVAATFESVRREVDDSLQIGDLAVLVGRIFFRGQGSEAESESAAGWVLKFREGKLLSYRAFRDPTYALECAGLEE
jgi:ketosteroid isomerase-like protein